MMVNGIPYKLKGGKEEVRFRLTMKYLLKSMQDLEKRY